MQELIQVEKVPEQVVVQEQKTKKRLTWEEIVPYLSGQLAKFKQLDTVQKIVVSDTVRHNPSFCVVGEAWGQSGSYCNGGDFNDCNECKYYSSSFPDIFDNIAGLPTLNENRLNELKDGFVEHWNDCHVPT